MIKGSPDIAIANLYHYFQEAAIATITKPQPQTVSAPLASSQTPEYLHPQAQSLSQLIAPTYPRSLLPIGEKLNSDRTSLPF